MSVFFNVSSLILGFLSIFLPILIPKSRSNRLSIPGISFLCCALSLLLQLAEIQHRIKIGDVAAVMDTGCAVTLAGTILLVSCVIVNLVVRLARKK